MENRKTPSLQSSLTIALALTLALESAVQAAPTVTHPELLVSASATDSHGRNVRSLEDALKHSPVEFAGRASVFSKNEAQMLEHRGYGHLGQTLRLRFKSEADRERFQAWAQGRAKDRKLPLEVESNQPLTSFDRYLPDQWGMVNSGQKVEFPINAQRSRIVVGKPGEDIGVSRARAEDPKNPILVAVIDTGVDVSHPELKDRIHRVESECQARAQYESCLSSSANLQACHDRFAKLDTDGNGYPLDCYGWNVTGSIDERTGLHGDADPFDSNGHGTHVAGIIAARADAEGVQGVSQSARILPVKANPAGDVVADNASAESGTEAFARAVLYSVQSKARIINLSQGWRLQQDSPLTRQMVEMAQKAGVIVVAAAGNSGYGAHLYPCLYPGVVCVASHDPEGNLSRFSNFGSTIDIVAPGDQILSTWPRILTPRSFTERRGWEIRSGTSMATPFVSGLLARLLNHGISASEAVARLIAGARPGRSADARFTRGGNADLAGAETVTPQPLVLPSSKGPLLSASDATLSRVTFKLRLRNFWLPSQSTRIQARLIPGSGQGSLRLEKEDFALASWASGEERTLDLTVVGPPQADAAKSAPIDSDFRFELTIACDTHAARIVQIQAETLRLISPDRLPPEARSLPIGPAPLLKAIEGSWIRPFTPLAGASDAIEFGSIVVRGKKVFALGILRRGNGGEAYEIIGPHEIAESSTTPFHLSRLDIDGDSRPEYVVGAYVDNPKTDAKPKTFAKFFVFDETFKPKKLTIFQQKGQEPNTYTNDPVPMQGRFRWLKLDSERRTALVPAWLDFGPMPELNRPARDPWKPIGNATEDQDFRVFYLGPQGLGAIEGASAEIVPVSLLEATEAELINGQAEALMALGSGFVREYAGARIVSQQGRLRFEIGAKIALARSHFLLGILPAPVLAADPHTIGSLFSSPSTDGSALVTAIVRDTYARTIQAIQFRQDAYRAGSSIAQSLGLYISGDWQFFSQSAHEIGIRRSSNANTQTSSLRTVSGGRQHALVRLSDGQGGFTGGAYLERGQSAGMSSELVTLSGEGSILRPMSQRYSELGCQEIGLQRVASNSAPRLHYLCGTTLVELPLEAR
jgi:subtilisin family serine protease